MDVGDYSRTLKHHMIAVAFGNSVSLEKIRIAYGIGVTTKDDYANALQTYQAYLVEIKSPQRDRATALGDA